MHLELIGPYILEEPLGEGGMGRVFRARHVATDRAVALKVLLGAPRDTGARFRREMMLMGRVTHPNLVRIFGGGTDEGVSYIAMELIDGSTLENILAVNGRLPLGLALHTALDLARGLAHLHALGIVHRDLKPANTMLSRNGCGKLLDFGLVRRLESTQLTHEGQAIGTVAFMAPELIRGEPTSLAADMWAMGCLLFEMVTGRPAIPGRTVSEILQAIMRASIPAPRNLVPALPEALSRLVLSLLDRNPDRRPAAEDLLAALQAIAATVHSRPLPVRRLAAKVAVAI
jgi:serine/threonine protein kinase